MAAKIDVGVLQRLSELDGPSGFEDEVREYVKGMAAQAGADVSVDRLGNVIASVRGPPPHVMLVAHMDEIGLMVSEVDDDGFLFFTTIGGWDPRLLPGLSVRVLGSRRKLYGTIGNSGAYAFDRFEAARDSHRLNLTVWGRYTDNEMATQQIVELRGKEYPVAPLYQGRFSVNVRQPDSTFLRDSLLVF